MVCSGFFFFQLIVLSSQHRVGRQADSAMPYILISYYSPLEAMRTPCQTSPELNDISNSGALGIVSSHSQGMTDVPGLANTQPIFEKYRYGNKEAGIYRTISLSSIEMLRRQGELQQEITSAHQEQITSNLSYFFLWQSVRTCRKGRRS